MEPADLCLAITQSGETADTLAAVKEARARGARAYAICNVVGSAITRECDGGTLFTHAGPEIGVASTKAFTTQLAALFLLAVRLGRLRGTLSAAQAREQLEALRQIPLWMEQVLRAGGGARCRSPSAAQRPATCSSSGAATSSRWRSRGRSS